MNNILFKIEKQLKGLNSSKSDLSEWLDNQDVCILMNISDRKLLSLRQKGLITFSRIDRKIYYKKEDILNYIKRDLKTYTQNEISVKELEESPLKEHEHTFFELVYILSGTGLQCINNNKFDYHEGHMFLITPQDCHSFDIHTTTKFFFIRFNDIYIYIFILVSLELKILRT